MKTWNAPMMEQLDVRMTMAGSNVDFLESNIPSSLSPDHPVWLNNYNDLTSGGGEGGSESGS